MAQRYGQRALWLAGAYIFFISFLFLNAANLRFNMAPCRVFLYPTDIQAGVAALPLREQTERLEMRPAKDHKPFRDFFIRRFNIIMPPEEALRLQRIDLDIGGKVFTFSREQFLKEWTCVHQEGKILFFSPEQKYLRQSRFALYGDQMVNWRGDSRIWAWGTIWFFCLAVMLLAIRSFFSRTKVGKKIAAVFAAFGPGDDPGLTSRALSAYPLFFSGGLVFLAGCLYFLEMRFPYYFCQDDNLVQFLPVMLQGLRDFFHQGIFPSYDPFQNNGIPTASLGYYGFTYPLTYLAYFCAAQFLHNEILLIDVYAIIHLIAGYSLCVLFFRRLNLRPLIGVLASLSFILCGYHLIGGRSWYHMFPVALWFPALMLLYLHFREKSLHRTWPVAAGLVGGLLFHAGNFQMWLYCMGVFYVLAFLHICRVPGSRLKIFPLIAALFFTGAIVLPFVAVTAREIAGVSRFGGTSTGIEEGLAALFLPYPLAQAGLGGWGNEHVERMGHVYYNGSLFNMIWAATVLWLGWLALTGTRRAAFWQNFRGDAVWLIASLVIFLFALGNAGVLWNWLAILPVFQKFNLAFKFLPLLNFFMITTGALALNAWVTRWRRGELWLYVVAAVGFVGLGYHVAQCRTAFATYADQPFRPFPAELKKFFSTETNRFPPRVCTVGFERSYSSGYLDSLPLNIPTAHKILAFHGYEPLVSRKEITKENFRQYGVRYVLVSTLGQTDMKAPYFEMPRFLDVEGETRFSAFLILSLKEPMPMAFVAGYPRVALPVEYSAAGARITTPAVNTRMDVVVNLQFRKFFLAFSGKRALKVQPDDWERVLVKDCPPGTKIDLLYLPPWGKYFGGSLLCFTAGFVMILGYGRRRKADREPDV
ncbi:MAG: hypothetical protein HQL23_04615 [Candidatus Omnitrophica bacterium]|nr:hypothetical protein [Candidatus Omnitrophota bacterium]